MGSPSPADWGFDSLLAENRERAEQLAAAGSPDELIQSLVSAIEEAVACHAIRLAVDSIKNQFDECRAIVQFKISPNIYDWFYSGRTGYRAQYWISSDMGVEFNGKMTSSLVSGLTRRLPSGVRVRRIKIIRHDEIPESLDDGETEVSRDFIIKSLTPEQSKIWIGEWLISRNGEPMKNIGFATLAAAARCAKLCIPKWASVRNSETGQVGEGLRAPYPPSDYSWLDLKGGLVLSDGTVKSTKVSRALDISRQGWT